MGKSRYLVTVYQEYEVVAESAAEAQSLFEAGDVDAHFRGENINVEFIDVEPEATA